MENELTKQEQYLINACIISSVLGIVSSIIPTILLYFLALIVNADWSRGISNAQTQGYLLLVIPIFFYTTWFFTIALGVESKIKKEIKIFKIILFVANLILTLSLLGFYIAILLNIYN